MQGDSALGRALGLVRELRQRCPWDRAQTPQTLRPYLVEEALELDHAIQTDDPEAMRDELGDRLQERAAGIGFDWPDAKGPLAKVKEETSELEQESGRQEIEEEVGDLLFAAVNLARKLGVEPGQALERANAKFQQRFEGVEKLAEERGLEMGRATLEQLDTLWDEVKKTKGA